VPPIAREFVCGDHRPADDVCREQSEDRLYGGVVELCGVGVVPYREYSAGAEVEGHA
jgi:hypothetical protein